LRPLRAGEGYLSVYVQASKVERQQIRKAMLVQADDMLKGIYTVAAQRHAAARVMVDRALAKEREKNEQPIVGNA
jgi:hypothetical protein